jgi:hypothetical protein
MLCDPQLGLVLRWSVVEHDDCFLVLIPALVRFRILNPRIRFFNKLGVVGHSDAPTFQLIMKEAMSLKQRTALEDLALLTGSMSH